jgi:hypothetical protein
MSCTVRNKEWWHANDVPYHQHVIMRSHSHHPLSLSNNSVLAAKLERVDSPTELHLSLIINRKTTNANKTANKITHHTSKIWIWFIMKQDQHRTSLLPKTSAMVKLTSALASNLAAPQHHAQRIGVKSNDGY